MKFNNLQALRAVAALMVFFAHLVPHGFGMDWFLYRFWWVGPAGVDLFFVISGFIVCYTAVKAGRTDEPAHIAAGKFAIKRVVRIFPVYWIVLALAWLIAGHVELAPPDLPAYPAWRYWLLLVVHNNKVMLAWTLAYEMFFYLVLAVLILLSPRNIYRWLAGWVVLQAGVIALAGTYRATGFDNFGWVMTSPLVLEFAAGCLVAYLIDKGVRGGGWQSLLSGIFLFSVGIYVNSQLGNWQQAWRVILFAPGAAMIVYGLINIEADKGIILPRFLQRVGDASYSIYIWHQLVVAILVKVTHKFGLLGPLPGWALVICYGLICLAVGFISYLLIEKPTQRWIHTTLDRWRAPKRRSEGSIQAHSSKP